MPGLLDLLFPSACASCRRPGPVACSSCASALRAPARLRVPAPPPPGLPPPYAVADYADATRSLLLAYKERDEVALGATLADALARSLVAAVAASAPATSVALVPVPSTRAAVRRRGFDPVARLARRAAARARSGGVACAVVPALIHSRAVDDSAGLSAAARAANLGGALVVRASCLARVSGRVVVVVDDVVTTGATLAEAARALRAAGAVVTAAATVAATVRRAEVVRAGLHNPHRGDYGAGRGPTPAEEAPGWTSS